MTFNKPKNVKYTDMCIYVDSKVQQDSITDEEASLCYEYLYHIIYMLAVKNKYFNKEEYYDEFSITLASDVFHRLFTHPKLKEYDEFGNPLLPKMKSCLNYIKAILYGRKVAFEQKNYSQKYLDMEVLDENFTPVSTSFTYTRDNLDFTIGLHANLYLENISNSIKDFLVKTSPYRKQPLIFKHIYLSCLLSIINSLTFTPSDQMGIQSKYVSPEAKDRYLYKLYKHNKDNCTVLYRLPQSFNGYITVVVRQLFTIIGKEIQDICKEQISIPQDVLMNISLMEIAGKDFYDD